MLVLIIENLIKNLRVLEVLVGRISVNKVFMIYISVK